MRTRFAAAMVLTLSAHFLTQRLASAATLVGDPFVNTYTQWVDAFPPPTRAGNWRVSLHNPTLMDTNNANPPTSGAVVNAGTYEPDVLFHNNFVAPGTYDYSARMYTNDDDIVGIVWNYQDPQNYFRAGIRTQAAGTFGGTQGVSIQKIVGGVLTQLNPAVIGPGAATPITQAMINNRTPFDMKVVVNGSNYDLQFNGTSIYTGTDADLAADRRIGVQSWAQLADTDETPDPPFWGTEIESVVVTQGANTLLNETFAARPIKFRQVLMTNAAGVNGLSAGINRDTLGNFGLDIEDPWVYQPGNGFVNATVNNIDFIGPAVIVDEPGATGFSDYEMRVRIGTTDNDGIGVIVRAQDDNNFYRITFTNESTAGGTTRAPRGMSVQKVRNGVWSELYRDDGAPLFVYTPSPAGSNPETVGFTPFDLSVKALGNTLDIQVIDHLGNVTAFPLIVDAGDPLLAGSVGFQTWGTDNAYFLGYGGQSGPLLVDIIPEPSTMILAAAAVVVGMMRKRYSR
jgi:hypothetical protein